MQLTVGEILEGKITGITNFGVFVELENTVEGMIRIEDLPQDQYEYLEDRFTLKGYKRSFTIGDKLTVKNIRADILSREIDFELVLYLKDSQVLDYLHQHHLQQDCLYNLKLFFVGNK